MVAKLTEHQRLDLALAVALGEILCITPNIKTLWTLGYLTKSRKSLWDNDVWLKPTDKGRAVIERRVIA